VKVGMSSGISDGNHAFAVAVIDGPYDAAALSGVLANGPVNLADGSCDANPSSACDHGTFIVGLLGARQDSLIPGLCPDCRLVHIPLFVDAHSPSASVDELATAIAKAVNAGARLINLSLAILGAEQQVNPRLAAALDFAEASGALLLAAAGNQGRLAMGQLLSHPVVIPVVAADPSQKLLPESNFGPVVSRRGVAALGRMPGYAPGGGTTVMSGTSVATAVATGILAEVWSEHPDIDGAALRSAVAGLGPRTGSKPPILNRDFVAAALDQMVSTAIAAAGAVEMTSYASLQGATTMANGNGRPVLAQGTGLIARPAQTVTPAGGGCGCGAPGGVCSCHGAENELSGFVYAIGTIEADYPNVAIEREMQTLAHHLGVDVAPDRDLTTRPTEDRQWQHAVLSKDLKLTRYIARQLRWRLTIEEVPVFVLSPSDPSYFDDLIDALKRPKYAKPERRGGKRAVKEAVPVEAPTGYVEDLDVVVGVAGPQTPDGIAVVVDQIFQVNRNQLAPGGRTYLSQLADNRGLTDEERACNFLAARYTPAPPQVDGYELSGMRVTPSRLSSGIGRVLRAIYTFSNAAAGEKEHFVRVDVTHEFPMIVSPMQPYLERGERT
jgi:Subtilase family/PatG Domain/PatG C-terminal